MNMTTTTRQIIILNMTMNKTTTTTTTKRQIDSNNETRNADFRPLLSFVESMSYSRKQQQNNNNNGYSTRAHENDLRNPEFIKVFNSVMNSA